MKYGLFFILGFLSAVLLGACGGTDVTCEQDCSDRECGLDPVCGESCGSCGDFATCREGLCDCDYLACGEICCADGESCRDGACVQDPCADDVTCIAAHRECVNDQGTAVCGDCLGGFHEDGDACVVDEECLPGTCSGHGDCDDSSGVPLCACHAG